MVMPENDCSAIIGKYVVYFDWSHITASYSAYLATVMGVKLQPEWQRRAANASDLRTGSSSRRAIVTSDSLPSLASTAW